MKIDMKLLELKFNLKNFIDCIRFYLYLSNLKISKICSARWHFRNCVDIWQIKICDLYAMNTRDHEEGQQIPEGSKVWRIY